MATFSVETSLMMYGQPGFDAWVNDEYWAYMGGPENNYLSVSFPTVNKGAVIENLKLTLHLHSTGSDTSFTVRFYASSTSQKPTEVATNATLLGDFTFNNTSGAKTFTLTRAMMDVLKQYTGAWYLYARNLNTANAGSRTTWYSYSNVAGTRATITGEYYDYVSPGTPTGAKLTPASVVQGQPYAMSWTPGTPPAGMTLSKYEVTRGGVLVSSPTGASASLTAPAIVGKYQHAVRAIGSVNGYYSAYTANVELNVTAAAKPTVSGVTLSNSHAAASENITLSWSASADAANPISKYQIYRSVNGAAYALLAEQTAKTLTTPAPATAGQSHRYYIVAVGTYSNSDAVYSGYLYAYKAPGAPTGVSVSPASVLPGAAVRVAWSAGAAGVGVDTTKFEVYRDGVLIGSTTNATTYLLDTTAPGTPGSAAYTVKAIGSVSGYNSPVSASATLTIQTPASTGSLNKTTVPMDGSSTIQLTISPSISGLTHKAVWSFGGASSTQNVATGAQPPAFTLPLAWCAQIPSAVSGTAKVTLETYLNGTMTGSNEYTFTVTVPASVVPTAGTLNAALIANGVDATITKYVQNYSGVALTSSGVAGVQGSTISAYNITGGGFSANSANANFSPLPTSGTITFTLEVTDSRGRKATTTKEIVVEAYAKPTLSGVSAYRCINTGVEASNGTYVRLFANRVFSSIGGQNSATLRGRVYMKGAAAPAYTNMTPGTAWVTGAGGILVTKSYLVEIQVSDKINSTTIQLEIPTDIVGFNVLDTAAGAAIGKYAETPNELQLPETWRLRGNLQVKDVRGTNPTPDAMPANAVSTFFNDQYGHSWMSGFTVKGWGTSYQAWQLAAPSSYDDNERLLFRVGRGAAWGGWREILTSNNWTSYITLATLGAAAASHGNHVHNDSLTMDNNIDYNNLVYDWDKHLLLQPIHTPNYTGVLNSPIGNGYGALITLAAGTSFPVQFAINLGASIFKVRSKYAYDTVGTKWTGVAWKTLLHDGNYNDYAPTKTGTGASGTWGISITGSSASLTTARTLTIGNTGKTFNGSANVSWTVAEIGAAAASHSHPYLDLFNWADYTGYTSPGTGFGSSAAYGPYLNFGVGNYVGQFNCGYSNYIPRLFFRTAYNEGTYTPSAWVRLLHTGNVTKGTGAPSGGEDGDIYIQYV